MSDKTVNKTSRLMKFIEHPVYPWLVILAVGIFLLVFKNTRDGLWYDESYSVMAVNHPIFRLVPMIGRDSHPPLYFILLRMWAVVFGRSIFSVRTFSALGIVFLASLGYFPLQKMTDRRTGMIFSLLVFLTPMAIVQGQEIRMYGWTAFFVTGAVLCGIWAFRENTIKKWILTGVFTLAAAYTHYYGLIAVGCFHLLLLIALLVKKREGLGRYGIMAGGLFLAYFPWFFMLYGQASRVVKNYWIWRPDMGMIYRILIYPFSYKFFPSDWALWGTLFAFILVAAGTIWGIIKKRKEIIFPLAALLVSAMTLSAAYTVSILIKPILIERYMVSCLGLFILAVSCGVSLLSRKWLHFPLLAGYAFLAALVLIPFYDTCFNGPIDEVVAEIEDQVQPGDVFVHGSEHNLGTFSYYFPENRHYLYIPEGFVPYSNYDIFTKVGGYGPDYRQFLNYSSGDIWATNRGGEPYSLPTSIYRTSENLEQVGRTKQYSRAPGWYQLSVSRYKFIGETAADDPAELSRADSE